MKKIKNNCLALLVFWLCQNGFGQYSGELGLLLNVSSTTLRVPNAEILISTGNIGGIQEGTDTTGRDINIMAGVYGSYAIDYLKNVGLELFYDRTSSKQIENVHFSALNLNLFLEYDPLNINLYANLGAGAAYILNDINLENENYRQKKFDAYGKVSLAYKFDNLGRIEVGTYFGVREVVEDYATRSKYYVGVKIPLSTYFID